MRSSDFQKSVGTFAKFRKSLGGWEDYFSYCIRRMCVYIMCMHACELCIDVLINCKYVLQDVPLPGLAGGGGKGGDSGSGCTYYEVPSSNISST